MVLPVGVVLPKAPDGLVFLRFTTKDGRTRVVFPTHIDNPQTGEVILFTPAQVAWMNTVKALASQD